MTKMQNALALMITAHQGQLYGGNCPYSVHCEETKAILESFGVKDEDILIAALLHDVLEDTTTTQEDLMGFGPRVVKMVTFCTDASGPNRKTRKALTYARCRTELEAKSKDAIDGACVKLADRIANLRHCTGPATGLLAMYRKEKETFRSTYFVPGVVDTMWLEYERLLT